MEKPEGQKEVPELTDEGGGGGGLVMFSKSRAKRNPSKAPPREEQFVYLAFALMPSSGHLPTGPGGGSNKSCPFSRCEDLSFFRVG